VPIVIEREAFRLFTELAAPRARAVCKESHRIEEISSQAL